MPFSLSGRVVLVTGASAGIGAAIARLCSAAGARLLLVARRRDRLDALVAELPGESQSLVLDVRDPQALPAALSALPADWQAVHALVLNAGLDRAFAPADATTPDDVDADVDTNVKALVYAFQAVVPGMRARGAGHVVTIGSVAGRQPYPNGTVYCATKAAVKMLAAGFKIDVHGTPIRVTNIEPGLVETEFSLVRFGDADRAAKVYADTDPLTPADVADAVLYALTRPPHVNVSEILVLATAQSTATMVHRREA
jgi:3-hydroxy acid dehydrogenase / malonic semialdehyde reductase